MRGRKLRRRVQNGEFDFAALLSMALCFVRVFKMADPLCRSVPVAGSHIMGVFVTVCSMAVEIFCYIVKDGGLSTCRSLKHGGPFSLPCAFPDRFCRRDNMADLVMWLSWQFVMWTSWQGFLTVTFLAGFAPGGPAALLKMAGFAAKSERRDWPCWIAAWPTQSERVVELVTAS